MRLKVHWKNESRDCHGLAVRYNIKVPLAGHGLYCHVKLLEGLRSMYYHQIAFH